MARMILLAGLTVGFGFGLTSLIGLSPEAIATSTASQVAAR